MLSGRRNFEEFGDVAIIGGGETGSTYHVGDDAEIGSRRSGVLANRVGYAEDIEPITFGTARLIETLTARDRRARM